MDTVEKIVALGEDVENFGKGKGTITYTLTEDGLRLHRAIYR